ncbi:MAG: hypothetical protein HFH88_09520 [Lachnospiraceae bacterium]|nr:hypothetical protein [Lachnospiraceae bacterium]
MKLFSRYMYTAAFIVMLLTPFLIMNRESNAVSEIDNKVLSEFPEWGEGFQDGVEVYISERLGGRDKMIAAYTILNDFLFQEMVHPTYMYGKDGYVFFKMHDNIKYGDFHQEFVQMVSKIDTYCKERGVKFYFLFSPEKLSVYRRYLPEGVNYENEWVDRLVDELENMGVVCINNTDYLTALSHKEIVFNKKYDAGHWNDLGCFYGLNHLFSRIHEDFPVIEPLSLSDFNISVEHKDSLPVSEFKIDEDVPAFRLKNRYEDYSVDVYKEIELNPDYRHFHYYVNREENAGLKPKILTFQGSYLNGRPPFIIANASIEVGIHSYQNILNFDYYFNIFKPDIVIFEVAEYVLSDRYFAYEGMKNLELPPTVYDSSDASEREAGQLFARMDEYPISASGVLWEGEYIDTLVIDKMIPESKYIYLYANEQIYDLKKDDKKGYTVCIEHEKIRENEVAKLIIQNEDGARYYTDVRIRKPVSMLNIVYEHSENALKSGDSYTFNTYVEGNTFSWVGLMLYNPKTDSYPDVFGRGYEAGENVSDIYIHKYESGNYRIFVKANSNVADETYCYDVYLKQGQKYYVEYTVDVFTETEIEISNFKFVH